MLGAAEAGTIVICSCLPVLRPLIIRAVEFTKSNLSGISRFTGSTFTANSRSRTHASHASLDSAEYHEGAPINLREGVIHRRLDIDVESSRKDYQAVKPAQGGF